MKKIGEIKGVPVVEGNINEVTRNQIHYKEDSGNIQLSKRDSDNKLNSITGSSSSGDSGVKEYYYKVLDDKVIQMIKFLAYGETIINISTGENINGSLPTLYENSTYKSLLAVKIYDIKLYVFNASDGVFNKNLGPFEGDIWNRMATYTLAGGETVTPEQIKEQLSSMIQEITKEEYESLITYKPE